MKILVMNCGSSSLKYQLIDMENEHVLTKGLCERIGIEGSVLTHKVPGKDNYVVETPMPDHSVAVKLVLDALTDKDHGVIKLLLRKSMQSVTAYSTAAQSSPNPSLSTTMLKLLIRECFDLGPLHNPANLMGIEACEKAMPRQTKRSCIRYHLRYGHADEKSYLYAIPHEYL